MPCSNQDLTFSSTDPISPRVERMMEEYIEVPFRADDEFFDNFVIYVQRCKML